MLPKESARRGFGIECDPLYVDVAIRRWEALTGSDAIHAATGLTFAEIAESRKNGPEVPAQQPASNKKMEAQLMTTLDGNRPGRDYPVGRGKPPKHTQFKPGESGNPNGRPKGHKNFATLTKEILLKKITAKTPAGPKKMTIMEALLWRHIQNALVGDTKSLAAILRLSALAEGSEGLPDPASFTADDEAIIQDYLKRLQDSEDKS